LSPKLTEQEKQDKIDEDFPGGILAFGDFARIDAIKQYNTTTLM
jgi:hypothetical protein